MQRENIPIQTYVCNKVYHLLSQSLPQLSPLSTPHSPLLSSTSPQALSSLSSFEEEPVLPSRLKRNSNVQVPREKMIIKSS